MRTSEFKLKFHIWDPELDPEHLTGQLGVTPLKTFRVGERRGNFARARAGWEWESGPQERVENIFDEFMSTFDAGLDAIAQWAARGANVSLSIVGWINGELLETQDDVIRRGIAEPTDPNPTVTPFVDSDRVEFNLEPGVVTFLAAIGASLDAWIDFDVSIPSESEKSAWDWYQLRETESLPDGRYRVLGPVHAVRRGTEDAICGEELSHPLRLVDSLWHASSLEDRCGNCSTRIP